MKNFRMIAIAMALVLSLTATIFAVSRLTTKTVVAKSEASCCADASCCTGENCKMNGACCDGHGAHKTTIAAKAENANCCGDASCCADGNCKMGGSCCSDHNACSTKKVVTQTAASYNGVPIENAETISCHEKKAQTVATDKKDCCAGNNSACCNAGAACCSSKTPTATTARL